MCFRKVGADIIDLKVIRVPLDIVANSFVALEENELLVEALFTGVVGELFVVGHLSTLIEFYVDETLQLLTAAG